jgi:anaerobic nitric oxide reductase flavorubredoxin
VERYKTIGGKIAEGIKSVDTDVVVKIYNISKDCDYNDLISEVFKSKTVVMGSPTINNSILHSVAGFIYLIKELKFKGKKAAAFGCYGWSGESVKIITQLMAEAGFEVATEGFRNQWNPNVDAQNKAVDFGKIIAKL